MGEEEGRARLAGLAAPALDRRLTRNSARPLVVAFSGGGDSLALLIGARSWADGAGRRLLAVTVDHRLQPAGAAWAAWCAARAARLGVEHRTLEWTSDKPVAGLAAAARAARHGLAAQAARSVGARVILMGHTADDILEARLMRAGGGSVPDPREWSPSPLWPEGRDLFILRPLIDARRAEIREALTEAGESWIDDPANDDPRHPRARARAALPAETAPQNTSLRGRGFESTALFLEHLRAGPAGDLAIARDVLRQARPAARRALVGAALVCAAGTERPPRAERLDRLVAQLVEADDFVATLAGARVEASESIVRIVREAGDARRRGVASVPLPVGVNMVWDGRFEIEARAPELTARALGGLFKRLDAAGREALKRVPRAARPGLPAVIDEEGRVACPALIPDGRLAMRSLVRARLAGALGGVENEVAMGHVVKPRPTT